MVKEFGLIYRFNLGIRRNWKMLPKWMLQGLGILGMIETMSNFSNFALYGTKNLK